MQAYLKNIFIYFQQNIGTKGKQREGYASADKAAIMASMNEHHKFDGGQ